MLETNKKLKTKTNKSFLEEVPTLTEAKCRTMQIARWKAEAAARPGSRPGESPTRAGRRSRQGGGQLRGGARVREAPRSSQAAAAAGGQAAQPRAHF